MNECCKKLRKDLWNAVQKYLSVIDNKLPWPLIVSHGATLDIRDEYVELMDKFGLKNPQSTNKKGA